MTEHSPHCKKKIDNAKNGSTITLENDYAFDEKFSTEGIKIDKNLIIEGNGHSLNGLQKSRIFYLYSDEKTQHYLELKNIKFSNGYGESSGGAIYGNPNDGKEWSTGFDYEPYRWHLKVDNCTFKDNVASGSGGAIMSCDLIISNSIFTNNEASGSGGVIFNSVSRDYEDCLQATNCTFNNNKAGYNGGALDICDGVFKNCIFKNNVASDGSGGAIVASKITINSCTFNSNKANGRIVPISNSGGVYTYPEYSRDYPGVGGAVCAYDDCIINNSKFTNNEALEDGGAIYLSTYEDDEYEGLIFHNQTLENCTFAKNVASEYGGAIFSPVIDGHSAKIMKCTFSENKASKFNDITGGKISNCIFKNTALSASKVTAIYGVSKNLVVTLKDAGGNVLKSKKVTVKVGTISKTLTTNNNGQVSVDVSKLTPKAYTATLAFGGDDSHIKSTYSVKVTVKKATPKLTAKAKTFKKSVKTKKYTVTLKSNKNKALNKVKLSLKVKGKTYYATTNKYGKATFKITKLTKKGKYTATLKFKGSKYYNAKTVKPKITIK